jgi:hypothetical protein
MPWQQAGESPATTAQGERDDHRNADPGHLAVAERVGCFPAHAREEVMNPHFSDQEARAILNERKMQRDNEWLKGQIGDHTYITSLMILGYRPKREAETELAILKGWQAEGTR